MNYLFKQILLGIYVIIINPIIQFKCQQQVSYDPKDSSFEGGYLEVAEQESEGQSCETNMVSERTNLKIMDSLMSVGRPNTNYYDE